MGLKFLDNLTSYVLLAVYISYNMGNRDLPDIYSMPGPAALRLGHIYQARAYISGKSLLPML